MRVDGSKSIWRRLLQRLLVTAGAASLTLACFLVLPLIQAIAAAPDADTVVRTMDTSDLPPPPPTIEEPEEEQPEPEEPPPELLEEAPPLDLSQLELALNPGFSDGWLGGDFAVNLDTIASSAGDVDALFSIADLDQQPRVIYQPSPTLSPKLRRRTPATVHVLFIVDQDGRVQKPIVQNSTDPAFEVPALAAVKQWKFDPGKRNGKAVRFRMRVPITFPES